MGISCHLWIEGHFWSISEKQQAANRATAAKSTGPPEVKAHSSQMPALPGGASNVSGHPDVKRGRTYLYPAFTRRRSSSKKFTTKVTCVIGFCSAAPSA